MVLMAMTTTKVKRDIVSFESVIAITRKMKEHKKDEISPNKFAKDGVFYNKDINTMMIDEDGNVFLDLVDSNQVMLPYLANLEF